MRNYKLFAFLFLFIITAPVLLAQSKGLKVKDYVNKDLKVIKVIIDDVDHSDKLGMVKITKKMWEEFDHEGNSIGKAEVIKIKDHEVKIKWVETKNGAAAGGISDYHISKKDGALHFKIHHDSVHKGYFEVTL